MKLRTLSNHAYIVKKFPMNQKKSQPHPWDWPTNPMDQVHKDYFKHNKNVFLIMVDSYSKWLDIQIVYKSL